MVRGWGRAHASDICPLTGGPLLPTIHIGPHLTSQGNPCGSIVPHPKAPLKGKTSGPTPGHKCPMGNPDSKAVQSNNGTNGTRIRYKKTCASYEPCPIRPIYRYKNTLTIGTYCPDRPTSPQSPATISTTGRFRWSGWTGSAHAGKIGLNAKGLIGPMH